MTKLDEIKARLEAATPGDWHPDKVWSDYDVIHASTDVAYLLKELEEKDKEIVRCGKLIRVLEKYGLLRRTVPNPILPP